MLVSLTAQRATLGNVAGGAWAKLCRSPSPTSSRRLLAATRRQHRPLFPPSPLSNPRHAPHPPRCAGAKQGEGGHDAPRRGAGPGGHLHPALLHRAGADREPDHLLPDRDRGPEAPVQGFRGAPGRPGPAGQQLLPRQQPAGLRLLPPHPGVRAVGVRGRQRHHALQHLGCAEGWCAGEGHAGGLAGAWGRVGGGQGVGRRVRCMQCPPTVSGTPDGAPSTPVPQPPWPPAACTCRPAAWARSGWGPGPRAC